MISCRICDRDVQPAITIAASGKPVQVCPLCEAPIGEAAPPQPPRGSRLAIDALAQSAPAMPGVIAKIEFGKGPARPAADPIALARAELKDIDDELERLDGLRRRRNRLSAMINAYEVAEAADPDPAAVRGSVIDIPETEEAQPVAAAAE